MQKAPTNDSLPVWKYSWRCSKGFGKEISPFVFFFYFLETFRSYSCRHLWCVQFPWLQVFSCRQVCGKGSSAVHKISLSHTHTHRHTLFTSLLWSNQLSLTCYIPIHSTYTGPSTSAWFRRSPVLFLSNGSLTYSSTSYHSFAKICVSRLTCFDTNHTFLHYRNDARSLCLHLFCAKVTSIGILRQRSLWRLEIKLPSPREKSVSSEETKQGRVTSVKSSFKLWIALISVAFFTLIVFSFPGTL